MQISTLAELDFADAREVLKGHIPEETPPVKICVGFHQGQAHSSWFAAEFQSADSEHNRIQLFHSWDSAAYALLHEYVHYLRRNDTLSSPFCVEAVTEEISTFECENRLSRLVTYSAETIDAFQDLGVWDYEHDCLNSRSYEMITTASYYLGYMPDTYISIAKYAVSHPEKMTWNYLSYDEGSCLAWYMTKLFGRDAVLSCSSKEDLDQLIGKPVDEFYNECCEWLLDQRELYGWG